VVRRQRHRGHICGHGARARAELRYRKARSVPMASLAAALASAASRRAVRAPDREHPSSTAAWCDGGKRGRALDSPSSPVPLPASRRAFQSTRQLAHRRRRRYRIARGNERHLLLRGVSGDRCHCDLAGPADLPRQPLVADPGVRHRLESVPGYGNKLAPAHIMQTGDRVLLIFLASAAAPHFQPAAPTETASQNFESRLASSFFILYSF